jgi:peptidoglycan/LPS O-acetylase OafA/YrhL
VLLCAVMRALGLFPATEMGIKTFLSGAYGTPPDWIDALRSATYGAMLYGDRSYDYVLWTISIEFYGSLLVFSSFALFGFDQKLLRKVVAVLAVLFAIQMGKATYYFLFFAGSFFATMDWHRQDRSIVRTLLASATLLLGLYLGGYAPGSASYSFIGHAANDLQKQGVLTLNWPILFYGMGAVLLIYAILATRSTHKFLASPPLRWLGEISFSLYLLHSLVLTASTPFVIKYMGFNLTSFFIAAIVTSSLTFIISHAFWKTVDIPFTRCADRVGKLLLSKIGNLPKNPQLQSEPA